MCSYQGTVATATGFRLRHLAEWFQFRNWLKLSWRSRGWSQKRLSNKSTEERTNACFRYLKIKEGGIRLNSRPMNEECRSWRRITTRGWKKRKRDRISKWWLISKKSTLICNKIIDYLTRKQRWKTKTLPKNLDTHSSSNPNLSRECIRLWKM